MNRILNRCNLFLFKPTNSSVLDSFFIFGYNQSGIRSDSPMRLNTMLKTIEWEAFFWLAGLIYLIFVDPCATGGFTFCPFHNLGITFCPGCGLGRSISFFYRGEILNSFRTHPLGIASFILISYRIIELLIKTNRNFNKIKEINYGKHS